MSNKVKANRERFDSFDQSSQLWLIYKHIEDIHEEMENLSKFILTQESQENQNHGCSCKEIKKLISEEIRNIPKRNIGTSQIDFSHFKEMPPPPSHSPGLRKPFQGTEFLQLTDK